MEKAIRYKALHSRLNGRNPDNLVSGIEFLSFTKIELIEAERYLAELNAKQIKWTFPEDENYPSAFYQMKEPPLFIEYIGHPCWQSYECISVVGARKLHSLSDQWMGTHFTQFLEDNKFVAVVSGGAYGVDFKAHVVSIAAKNPTIVVLPCGLEKMYPSHLSELKSSVISGGGAFISEFSSQQMIRKSNFFFRNRLIAALGRVSLVVQASEKSGTMLTVHHSLENGRPVFTLPAHPCLSDFKGNIKLMSEGAPVILDAESLTQIWRSELWSSY